MAKYENIRALAKKQLQAVTESSDRWKAFLRTAAIAYNYSFPNQLLIHEQSPTATAVADIAYWNNNAGRWVKRGAHGIAVFDTRANSSRLRYLFDISDTIPRAEIPDALPWVITDQNWRPVWDKIVADQRHPCGGGTFPAGNGRRAERGGRCPLRKFCRGRCVRPQRHDHPQRNLRSWSYRLGQQRMQLLAEQSCPLCQHHQRQLYEHGCRLLVLLHRRGAVYLLDCHIQLRLLLVFIHKL